MQTYRKIIRSGAVLEVEEYENLPALKHSFRSLNSKPTSERQKKLNEINSLKAFIRAVNTNFKPGDLYATLTYCKAFLPDTEEQAEKNIDNYMRRLKYSIRRQGLSPPKYIVVTGRKKSTERLHSHMLIAGVPASLVQNQWTAGHTNIKKLWDNPDYTDLATYLFAHCKDKSGKRWKQSRNLEKPVIDKLEKRYRRFNPNRAKIFTKGYIIVESATRTEYNPITGMMCYYKFIRNRN